MRVPPPFPPVRAGLTTLILSQAIATDRLKRASGVAHDRRTLVDVIERDLVDPMAEKGMPETDEMSDFRGKPSVGAGL